MNVTFTAVSSLTSCYRMQTVILFLTDRPQYVQFKNVNSSINNTNTGVTQGYVLSPLLFLLYTNDYNSI